ncbi:hypothetical protein E5083_19580 [Streptomyces bauhiniae]|uniref:Uncharacterized protein n=1 Tax=Streptomyces bauhiniae TaxID=2340725 RepID=A0A4Z1D259_9ACTN|nr:hypothetical protein [Streptomyces bauhiniae]TGN75836.1 hypothetical protein E5083_19580 [Streptomyces bauhiniae]
MTVVVVLVASEEDVEPVRLSCTEQGIYLPALAKIARLSGPTGSTAFQVDTNEAAAAVRRLVVEGLFAGPRGQYVNDYSAEQHHRRIQALCPEVLDRIRETV